MPRGPSGKLCLGCSGPPQTGGGDVFDLHGLFCIGFLNLRVRLGQFLGMWCG